MKRKVDKKILFQDYQAGLSLRQLSEKYDLAICTVHRNLQSLPGWEKKKRKRKWEREWKWPEERKNDVVALYAQGDSLKIVSQKMGTNRRYIRAVLLERGIRIRPQSEAQRWRYNPSWNGGRTLVGGYWYVYTPDHPNATSHGYVLEHRLLAEQLLGRLLLKTEVVHHCDGNPQNNEPSNLQVFSANGKHLALELTGRVPNWTEDGKRRIAEGVARMVRRRRNRARSKNGAQQSR